MVAELAWPEGVWAARHFGLTDPADNRGCSGGADAGAGAVAWSQITIASIPDVPTARDPLGKQLPFLGRTAVCCMTSPVG
jgi:hypothetical protein